MTVTKTITFEKVELEVTYNYSPEEAQTHDYPGDAETVEVEEVKHCGESIYDLIYNRMEEIETIIYKTL